MMKHVINRIKELEKQFRDVYMECYYHIHQNPEVGDQEAETSAYVLQKLREMGVEDIRTNVGGGYGITALIRGGKPGPVVGIRADMDALEVTEKTDCPFASKNSGVMHACGHDAHTAMQLGAARVLCGIKDELPGTVKLIFQPAEEKSPHGGARFMIEGGALEDPVVDAMLGLHVRPHFTTGQFAIQDGILSACSDRLKIKVIGKSAHAAMPHFGTDAIVAAGAVIGGLQSIISRNVNPDDAAVITLGLINGGARYNVIPDEVVLEGTVRTFNPAVTQSMPKLISRVAQGTAAAYGASAEVSYTSGYPSMENDPEVTDICRDALVDLLGKEALLPRQGRDPGGEDFAFFSLKVPSSYAFLGCRPPGVALQDQAPLHSSKFLPDPKALPLGVQYLATAAFKVLSGFTPRQKE